MFLDRAKRICTASACALSIVLGAPILSSSAGAQALLPSESSNPKTGYLYYKTEHCTAEVEVSLTLKGFDRGLFERLLAQERSDAEALCTAAAAAAPLKKPYAFSVTWRTRGMVRALDLVALSGREFRFEGGPSSTTSINSLVYDRAAARALELEDLFLDRELMRTRLVALVRKALATQKLERVGVTLTQEDLEALLPSDMSWPKMQWGMLTTSRGYRFKGLWFFFPKGTFSSLNGKDLRGRASSEGSTVLEVDHSTFVDLITSRYLDAFSDNDNDV